MRNSVATMFYLVSTKDEKLKVKFFHINWKLGRDIKESIRLKNSIATQKFYVATQSSVAKGNSVATKTFDVATYYSNIQAARHPSIVATQDTLVMT